MGKYMQNRKEEEVEVKASKNTFSAFVYFVIFSVAFYDLVS
jgi:hypothetical protein